VAGTFQTMTKAQMLAGNMLGIEGLVFCTDDNKLYNNDGAVFYQTNDIYWAIIQVVGSNYVVTTCNTLDSTSAQTTATGSGQTTNIPAFKLPAGVKVEAVWMESLTAFNAGTSDTLSIGISGAYTTYSNAINVHDAAGEETVTTAGKTRTTTSALQTYLQCVNDGAAPTAGKAIVLMQAFYRSRRQSVDL